MKKLLAVLLITFASTAFGADHISLPAEGVSSAKSIANCEAQLAKLKSFQKYGDKKGTGYKQINPGSDSFVYLFTTPAEPAHPAMLRITLHPMADPRHPQESEVEFFASYAGREVDFLAWSKTVLYDFGRGFGTAVSQGH